MAYGRILAATVFAASLIGGSAQAQAGGGCKKQCDAHFNSCSKAKGGDACLRTWHGCKTQCKATATSAAARSTPAPVLQRTSGSAARR